MKNLLKVFLLASSFVQIAHGQMKDDFKKEAEKEGSTPEKALVLLDQRAIRLGERLIIDPNFQLREWPWSFSLPDFLFFISENRRSVERVLQEEGLRGDTRTGLALRSPGHQLSDVSFLRPLQLLRAFQRHCATLLQQQLRQMNSEANQDKLGSSMVLNTITIQLPRLPYFFFPFFQRTSQRNFMHHCRMRGRGGESQLMLFSNPPLQNIQTQQSLEIDSQEETWEGVEVPLEICLEEGRRPFQSLENVRQVGEMQPQEGIWEGIDYPWEFPIENVDEPPQSVRDPQQLVDREAFSHQEETWEEAIARLGRIIKQRLRIGITLQPISGSSIMIAREKKLLRNGEK